MEPYRFTDVEKASFRKEYAPNATDDQWNLFIAHCERQNLMPGRHVVFHIQPTSVYSQPLQTWVNEDRVVLITTIEAMTLIADRTGKYDGQRPAIWYYTQPAHPESEFIKSEIPLGRICHAASVDILRKDWKEPMRGVARYDACVQKNTRGEPNFVWEKRGEEQTAKCARADGFRKAFPEENGGLYLDEEMPSMQHTAPAAIVLANTSTPSPACVKAPYPSAIPLLAVNQEPAQERPAQTPVGVPENKIVTAEIETEKLDPMTGIDKLSVEFNRQDEGFAAAKSINVAPVAEPETQPSIFDVADAEDVSPAVDVRSATDKGAPIISPGKSIPKIPDSPDTRHAVAFAPQAETPAQAASTGPIISASPCMPAEADAGAHSNIDQKPTVPEFRAYMTRCTKLVRDVLQKTGKEGAEASTLVLPYMKKATGQSDIQNMTRAQLDSLLTQFESMKVPELIQLLKGAK